MTPAHPKNSWPTFLLAGLLLFLPLKAWRFSIHSLHQRRVITTTFCSVQPKQQQQQYNTDNATLRTILTYPKKTREITKRRKYPEKEITITIVKHHKKEITITIGKHHTRKRLRKPRNPKNCENKVRRIGADLLHPFSTPIFSIHSVHRYLCFHLFHSFSAVLKPPRNNSVTFNERQRYLVVDCP